MTVMKIQYIITVLIFFSQISVAQTRNRENYLKEMAKMNIAMELREKGELDSALSIHQMIYNINPKNDLNNYNYACIYGLKENKDSSIKYLEQSLSFTVGLRPLSDPDFYFLHATPEWDSVEARIFRLNKLRIKNIKNVEFAKKLYKLCAADQAYYSEIDFAEKKYGHEAKQVKDIWRKKEKLNQQNQRELEELLTEKGWPKRSDVGLEATNSAFLIIQHSDLDKMKKYIPIIKKYCTEGEGSCSAFAMMFDRIKVAQNLPQRYGTQVQYNKKKKAYELFPLENEGQLHEYREWAGLPTIEDYVAHWDITVNIKKVERDFAYADSLVSAILSPESKYPYFHGWDFTIQTKKLDDGDTDIQVVPVKPTCVLGAVEDACLTMPKGTEVVIMFTDNQIVDYPDQPDLFIKEHGGADDKALVYVSHDGVRFDSLGITFDGRASSLDLASINYTKSVKFVKVVSLDNNGSLPGYDLVYIKGLPGSTVRAELTAMEIKQYLKIAQQEIKIIESLGTSSALTFMTSTSANHKILKQNTMVLEEILFDLRSATIQKKTYPYLNQLANELNEKNWQRLEIIGHTDNSGSEGSNESLSLNRAVAVRDYLLQKGIKQVNIDCMGKGATEPRRSNDTKIGRDKNRRVELKIFE